MFATRTAAPGPQTSAPHRVNALHPHRSTSPALVALLAVALAGPSVAHAVDDDDAPLLLNVTSNVDPEVYVEHDGQQHFAGRLQPSEQLGVPLPAGTHTVQIRCVRDGLVPWRATLRPAGAASLEVHCALAPPRRVLLVRTTAERTSLWLDDTLLGDLYPAPEPFTLGPAPPTTSTLAPGQWYAFTQLTRGGHRLCARAPGHLQACEDFTVTEGSDISRLSLVLDAAPTVTPTSRPVAAEPAPAPIIVTVPAAPAPAPRTWRLRPTLAAHAGGQLAVGADGAGLFEQSLDLTYWPDPRWGVGATALLTQAPGDDALGWGIGLRAEGALEADAPWRGWASLLLRQQGHPLDTVGDFTHQLYTLQAGVARRLGAGFWARGGLEAGVDEARSRRYRRGELETLADRRLLLAATAGVAWTWDL
ncbi:MAG: hypothetical protein H6704_22935 [Myxococcales bacterium]|nr:hypothetical protein [Myxococcales bacterium]